MEFERRLELDLVKLSTTLKNDYSRSNLKKLIVKTVRLMNTEAFPLEFI